MGSNNLTDYIDIIRQLKLHTNASDDLINRLKNYALLVHRSDKEDRFSEPMPWIGNYIAFASLLCILAMVADLLHGFRTKKLWFPCKYFTFNAAFFTVVDVAMKLPMDLSTSMPGYVDQAAKLGSMCFMCVMMSNVLPALATMDNKDLIANIIALGIQVITLVGNVCIQIKTGVIPSTENRYYLSHAYDYTSPLSYDALGGYDPTTRVIKPIAIIYVAMLSILLIIHACSSLAILKSKQILESKYQAARETELKDQELQQQGRSTVDQLKQHVRKYWIMAATGDPQFLTACSVTSCASGVISAISTILHVILTLFVIRSGWEGESDYKWSVLVIFITQLIGSLLGTIAPLSRCFAILSFKLSMKWIWNNMKIFNVESYWTQTLSDLKESSIPFPSCSRIFKIFFQNIKVLVLGLCMVFQKTSVVACKLIDIIPHFIVICIVCCSCCYKWLKSMLANAFGIVLARNPEQRETNENFSRYVLQLQDDMELAEGTLKRISNSFDHLIKKAEKQQPYHLLKLLEESTTSEGDERFYKIHHVRPLVVEEPLICWSLSLVTLTSIAISLTNIQTNLVDRLVRGLNEGIVYVRHVEESLHTTDDHVSIQKAAKSLWVEVEVYHNWLGNKLRKHAPQVNTAGQILQWLSDTAKSMVTEVEITNMGGQNDNSKHRIICSNSMYRLTETILLYYHADIDQVSQEGLFAKLSSLIAEILAACLTNLPHVIAMKCHSNEIEKREASVYDGAQLLGETTQIINTLQDRELPI
ncbi:hypothetical protein L2E82_03670 [Cichorium intybus]|uniref:Uncharacterized protein n=1 Tax=Cichorium intybus TaxID=13427 RepID=A0ACB9H3W9_CICIN|nr:hypothetical protein L2E82_03670 [Cichorium intybus]